MAFHLPRLTATEDEIVIRRAAVPKALPPIGTTFPNGQYNGNDILLDFPRVARFLLRDGNEILVDPAPSSDDGEVRDTCWVPRSACCVISAELCRSMHLRLRWPRLRRLCRRVRCWQVDVGCSPCSAWPSGRRRRRLFLQLGSEGLQAWPGISRIRLWEDAMVALGYERP